MTEDTGTVVGQIGETAGAVWKVLAENGPTTLNKLVDAVGGSRDTVMQAVGWLAARENLPSSSSGVRGSCRCVKTFASCRGREICAFFASLGRGAKFPLYRTGTVGAFDTHFWLKMAWRAPCQTPFFHVA